MQLVFKVSKTKVNQAITTLKEYYGVVVTPAQLKALLQKYPQLIGEIKIGLDTYGREQLIDALTDDLGLSHWPVNADSKQTTMKFFTKFFQKARQKGYGLIP
jgi:hypothetical protein